MKFSEREKPSKDGRTSKLRTNQPECSQSMLDCTRISENS